MVWNAAENVGHMDRNTAELGGEKGIFYCGTRLDEVILYSSFISFELNDNLSYLILTEHS